MLTISDIDSLILKLWQSCDVKHGFKMVSIKCNWNFRLKLKQFSLSTWTKKKKINEKLFTLNSTFLYEISYTQ